jgi:hypothetical protein
MRSDVRVVVARYNEDVAWLEQTGLDYVVYDKGPDPVADARILPNIGREAHTYLTHIVREWDSLAPHTAFVQGDPFDHLDPDRATGPQDLAALIIRCAERGVPFRGFAWFKLKCDGLGRPHDLNKPENEGRWAGWGKDIPVERVFRELFNAEPPAHYVARAPAGLFCVSAARVRTRPRAMYEHALRLIEDDPHDAENTGHAFERLWQLIFNGNTLWNKDTYA